MVLDCGLFLRNNTDSNVQGADLNALKAKLKREVAT